MASSGVNVKMGVSGIAQFKQNMKQAEQAVKTLDAQIALCEKQYKATGDAESYMTEKSELLKAKMEQQKNVVSNAEKALKDMADKGADRSSKAYQDLYRQMLQAQGGMIDTQTEIQGIEVASDNAADAVSDMASDLSSVNSQVSFQTVTEGLTKITDGLQAAAKKAWEFGKAMFLATLDSASWADEIVTAATKAGMSPEQYQQAVAAAELVDTSVDSIIASKQKLAQATEKDSKDMDYIFARLGIQTKRYGEVRDMNDLFWETGEALMNIQNKADQADMGKKLFGNWRELIPLFTMGREEYEKMRDSQSFVDQEHLQNLTELDDSYQTLQHEIEVLKQNFFAELAPSIKVVTDSMTGLVQKFNEFLKTEKGKEMMESLGDNIEKLFSSLTDFDADKAIETVGKVLEGVTTAFQWIVDNWSTIETGLLAIAGGWAAIKVATIGLNIGSLVAGMKGLPFFGGGSGAGGANATPTVDATPKGTAAGGGAAAAAGGGAFDTGAKVAATKASVNVSSALASAGMIPSVLIDRVMNETNFGRAVRDGGDVLEGASKDLQEATETIQKNAETFGDDWANLFKTVGETILDKLFPGSGENWSDLLDANGNLTQAAKEAGYDQNGNGEIIVPKRQYEYTLPSGGSSIATTGDAVDAGEMVNRRLSSTHAFEELQNSADKMESTATDLSKSTEYQSDATTKMTTAALGLMNLPVEVANAVINGMSGIVFTLDGTAITNYINQRLGQEINLARK